MIYWIFNYIVKNFKTDMLIIFVMKNKIIFDVNLKNIIYKKPVIFNFYLWNIWEFKTNFQECYNFLNFD